MYNAIKFFGSVKELLAFTRTLKRVEENQQGISFEIYPPNCAANPTDKFNAEIRKNGWAVDEQLFYTYPEAVAWAQSHTGQMSKGVFKQYQDMFQRWATK